MNNFLLDNFYSILESKESESKEMLSVKVLLNAEHPVYKGHFPGMPVAPGVCLIQMIQEILIRHRSQNIFLAEADDIKFLKAVTPATQNRFEIEFSLKPDSAGMIQAVVVLKDEHDVYLKMKCRFSPVPLQISSPTR